MNVAAFALLTIGLVSSGEARQKTGRAVVVESVVEAPPAEVFRLWTSEDGIRNFLAPDGHVTRRPAAATR